MPNAAIIREAEATREHKDAAINFILHDLDGIDGRVSAEMSKQQIADILVQHESETVLAMIGAVSADWAQALSEAQGKYIRIH